MGDTYLNNILPCSSVASQTQRAAHAMFSSRWRGAHPTRSTEQAFIPPIGGRTPSNKPPRVNCLMPDSTNRQGYRGSGPVESAVNVLLHRHRPPLFDSSPNARYGERRTLLCQLWCEHDVDVSDSASTGMWKLRQSTRLVCGGILGKV